MEYFVEGTRLVEEAFSKGRDVLKIVYSPRLEQTERGLKLLSLGRQKAKTAEWLYLGDEVLATLSDTRSHQGVLAVMKMEEYRWEDLFQMPGMILILHELQDPGNLGTIFRVGEAGGAAGFILSAGTLDPYNLKVVRASMGSLFRLPFLIQQNLDEVFPKLRSQGHRILAADVRGGSPFWNVDFSRPTAVLLGQEGSGLPSSLMQAVDGTFSIPMAPRRVFERGDGRRACAL